MAILLEKMGLRQKEVIVNLGYRDVDTDDQEAVVNHRGKYKSLTIRQRRWLRCRQAIDPPIGDLKAEHRMDRCWLQGQLGDAPNAVLCGSGYNLPWLMRAMARLGLKANFLPQKFGAVLALLADEVCKIHRHRLAVASIAGSPMANGGAG